MQQPGQACMLIADISGYTDYLAGVELDHAQDILADLIGTVVGALRPRFRLAKLEGDAAFVYVMTEVLDASLLQDAVEGTYFAFRRRLRDIRSSTQCECNACTLLPRLDLKFVVHHGLVVTQRMAGREELVGRDVILIHRLLKNGVEARIGHLPYALYTDACVAAMKIDPEAQGLIRHTERIDVIGEVTCWLRDLEAAWQRHLDANRLVVAPEDAVYAASWIAHAPREAVWDFFTSPLTRPSWGHGVSEVREVSAGKTRRGAGTVNHCMHGKDVLIEEVVDWRPYDYFTTRYDLSAMGVNRLTMTSTFAALDDGSTEVGVRVARPKPRERAAFEAVFEMFRVSFEAGALNIVAHFAEQRTTAPDTEPALPVSHRRFANEPVHRHHAHEA